MFSMVHFRPVGFLSRSDSLVEVSQPAYFVKSTLNHMYLSNVDHFYSQSWQRWLAIISISLREIRIWFDTYIA